MAKIPQIKTVLYASDLGTRMRPVFRYAISMARAHDARILMLHVVEPLGSTGQAVLQAYLPGRKLRELEQETMQRVLETMKARLAKFCEDEMSACTQGSPLVAEVAVAIGHPGEVIPREAEARGADLIVVGSCGDGLLSSRLLGSTARHVTQGSRVPVLVVPNNPKPRARHG